MHNETPARRGFTLVEVVVAIAVLGIGILALVGNAAATARSMADAARIGDAARAAEAARERAYASTCTASAGVDSVRGARITSAAVPTGTLLTVHQSIALSSNATLLIAISAAGPCR